MISPTQQATHMLTNKLTSYFKIKKYTLKPTPILHPDSGNILPMLDYDQIDGFYHHIYPVQGDHINIAELLTWSKFERGDIYSAYFDGLSLIDPRKRSYYVMALYVTGMVWMVYGSKGYEGIGGIYVGERPTSHGIVMTPIANFLIENYPREIVD